MDKWVMLGKPECKWCKEVETILHEHDIEFVYMNVVGNELTHFLINCGLTTVPQVFKNGILIGNYEETKEYFYG